MLAIDGGQSAIRARHSDMADSVELDGVSRLEDDPLEAVVAAADHPGRYRDHVYVWKAAA